MDFSGYQLPNNKPKQSKKVPVMQADIVIDSLIAEYGTPDFRGWYAKLVNTFGTEIISSLQARCSDATSPGKLFSKLAKEMMDAHDARQKFEEKTTYE